MLALPRRQGGRAGTSRTVRAERCYHCIRERHAVGPAGLHTVPALSTAVTQCRDFQVGEHGRICLRIAFEILSSFAACKSAPVLIDILCWLFRDEYSIGVERNQDQDDLYACRVGDTHASVLGVGAMALGTLDDT